MKEQIRQLIADGKTSRAIQALRQASSQLEDQDLQDETLIIAARYETYAREKRLGTNSAEEQRLALAQINHALLGILAQLPESSKALEEPYADSSPSADASRDTKRASIFARRNYWQWVVAASIVIGILAGIAGFSGYSLKDLFSGSGADDTFTVTVFVHGKKGTDERILKNQGQVMLGLRTNEMPGSINEKGEATFKEIPRSFKDKEVRIRIEHPQPYRATRPDSLYRLEPNAAIYVEVALEGMNRLFGRVMDFETEQWLDSVRVSVENIATFTDQYGWFELFIPEDKQRKFQRVSFYKAGYQTEDLDSIPVHTQQQIGISLKK